MRCIIETQSWIRPQNDPYRLENFQQAYDNIVSVSYTHLPFYFVVLRHGFGEEKDGQVGLLQHLAALLHTQYAEVAFIVETRRVTRARKNLRR